MILTGPEILLAREQGTLIIEPFTDEQLNPNSYNFRLGPMLLQNPGDQSCEGSCAEILLPASGYLLSPGRLYLGASYEMIGSGRFAMLLVGRSSLGRLGLFLNITADLGHAGSVSRWTLELTVVQPLRIYPYMRIGQISFWAQRGHMSQYGGRYHNDSAPAPNKDESLGGAAGIFP